jgi:hypothetical protein
MRLLAGILAGQPFPAVLAGDESLSRRPMRRIIEPLGLMGAKIDSDLRLTDATGSSEYPSLAWTESEFGVAWSDSSGGASYLYFTRVSAGGTKIGDNLPIGGSGGA